MLEGYGQTECAAAATMTVPGETTTGHVGPPLPCNDIKLVDVPDMNYFAANSEGEVSSNPLVTSALLFWLARQGVVQDFFYWEGRNEILS